MLAQGDTEGVFQLESSGMKQVLVGLQPQNLEDVIALISPVPSRPHGLHPNLSAQPPRAGQDQLQDPAARPISWM